RGRDVREARGDAFPTSEGRFSCRDSWSLAPEPMINQQEMGRDVIDPGTPRVRIRAVTGPLLPLLVIKSPRCQVLDLLPGGERQVGMKVDHVDLPIRVGGWQNQASLCR